MRYWLVVAVSLIAIAVQACGGCSAVSISSGGGQLLQNNKSYIGVSLLYDRQEFIRDESNAKDYSSMVQTTLFGAYSFKKKWQVGASLPYIALRYKYDRRDPLNNLGDLTLFVSYNVYNTAPLKFKEMTHSIYVQQGIKFPTGSIQKGQIAGETNFSSGSIDFLQSIKYFFEKNNKGLNSELAVQWNTKNKDKYHYGNRFSLRSYFFWKKKKEKVTIMPFSGLSGEYAAKDKSEHYIRTLTGGKALYWLAGLQVVIKDRFVLSLKNDLPLVQKQLNTDGENKRKARLNFNTIINF